MEFRMREANGQPVMMPPASVSTIVMPYLPVMVRTAIEYTQVHNHNTEVRGAEGARGGWRPTSALEEAAYESALGVITRYFEGRQKFNEKPDVIEVVRGGT